MKRLISVMLVVMMVFSLLPMSSLGETVEKITADAPNTGIEAANSNVEAVTNADGSTTYTNVYQRVSQIDDVNARYLIVYDGGAVDKAFTAHTTGNLQTAAGNATDISVTQLEGADGNGNENYYSITTTGGNALEAKHKWYFSSTTTDTNKKKAHAMYVRSELNDYYLQANSTRDSGTLFKINTKKYSDLSGNGYMFDELWLNEYPVPPKQNDTPLWGPTQATAATPVNGTTKFTIAELIAASTVVYDYYTANGELPGTIYINSGNTTYAVSDEDYNYMASKALANGTAGGTLTTTTSITYKNCGNPNVTSTSTYTGSTVTMAQLASIAAKSYAYVDNGNNYPASNGSVLSGTVNYDEIYLMNARALDYYADNSKLPSTITYVDMGTFTTGKIGDTPIAGTITGSATSTPTPAPTTPTTFTIAQIIQAARHELSVRGTYYLTAVSGSHSIGGYSVSRVDFFMLMCRAVVALNSGSATSATVPYKSYTEPSYSTEEYASGGTSLFTKANYVAYANAQINAHPNGGTPTSAFGSSTFSGLGSTANITYGAMICTLIRVLDLYGRNGSLPATVYTDSGISEGDAGSITLEQLGVAAIAALKTYNTAQGTSTSLTNAKANIPATISWGRSQSATRAQFFRWMVMALYYGYNDPYSTTATTLPATYGTGSTLSDAGSPQDDCTSTQYTNIAIVGVINLASRAKAWIDNGNTVASNYSTSIRNSTTATNSTTGTILNSSSGKLVSYQRQWLMFARTLAQYAANSSSSTITNPKTGLTNISTVKGTFASVTPPSVAVPATVAAPAATATPTPAPTPTPASTTGSDDVVVAISSPLTTTENCINVIPYASSGDAAVGSDLPDLREDYFMFTWYNDSDSAYYRTSYMRFTDGRYGDRFVFSPSRVQYTQLMTKGATGNGGSTLAIGTTSFASNTSSEKYMGSTAATAKGYGADEGYSAFLHFMRPSYMTIYKVVDSVTLTAEEEDTTTENVIPSDDPLYPEEGSVRINKHASVSDTDWYGTGVAEVELAVTGVGKRDYTDFVVIMDLSASMVIGASVGSTNDADNTRLPKSKEAIKSFVDTVLAPKANGDASSNRVALVTFGYYGTKAQGFTNNATTIKNAVTNANPPKNTDGSWAGNATNYDEAFKYANEYMATSTAKNKVILFLTDGAPSFYNDNHGWNYFGVTDENDRMNTNNWFHSVYNAGASIDPTNALGIGTVGGRVTDGNRFANATAITDVHRENYVEDVFAYSSMTDRGTAETTINVGEAVMFRNYVKNTTHLYSDISKANGYTVYSIGLDTASGSDSSTKLEADRGLRAPYLYYTGDEMETILTNIASSADHFYEAGVDDVAEVFQNIAMGYVDNAGDEAKVVDEMGQDFNLQLANYVLDGHGNQIPLGYNPAIRVTNYNLVTLAMVDGVTYTTNNIGDRLGGEKLLEEVTFNADGTEAYSNVLGSATNILTGGKINAKYFTYDLATEVFTWNLNEITEDEVVLSYYVYLTGSMSGERSAGVYDTNEIATLEYINLNGKKMSKEFPIPQLPWGGAAYTYEYYLVNDQGQPVNLEGTVVGLSSRVTVYGPITNTLNLNDEAVTASASAHLPKGYSLYDASASYTVQPNSVAGAAGSYTLTGNGTVLISGNTEMTASHVAFAVLYTVGLVDDYVVIDWDKTVLIDVTTNDTISNPKLVGVMLNTQGDLAETVNGVAINSGSATSHSTGASVTGDYGTAEVKGGKLHYTLNTFMDGIERLYCCVSGDVEGVGTRYFYSRLNIAPATNVYYEDSFEADDGDTVGSTGIYYNGAWTVIGTEQTGETQSSGDNPYGYDASYNDDVADSNGSTRVITNSSTSMNTAIMTFTFKGTGFDIIGRTSTDSGKIMFAVTDVTDNKIVHRYIVDTVYSAGILYQIPYISFRGDEYSTYKVELLAIGTTASPQKVYVDGIRIYNPVGMESKDNPEDYDSAKELYQIQGESNPVIYEIRNMFYGENPDLEGELSGAVFIDGTAAATNKTDAYNFGPNNEMYIGKNQTFAVSVTTKAIPASIQIGAKNPLAADSANTVFTVSEIAEAASDILAYYNANHVLPRIIGLIGHDEVHSISDEDFVYLSSMALSGISESGYTADTEIAYRNVGKPTNDAAGHYDGTEATQAQFTEIAARTANYILTEGGNAPAANGSVMTGSDGTIYQISYDSVYLMFARALDAYNTSGSLPATVAYDRLDYVLAEDSNGGPIAGKNLTFTVGSTAAIARTLRVTSATEMFYEVTGAVNFVKNVDGTYTGNIILTNTSSADAVLSLTKLKLVMNGAGAAAASEFSANQNLIDSAIALTEARKDGEGLTEGVVIEINSGVEYENGKVIKPLTAFNVETMSDEIFDNAAKWFFSKLR